MLPKSLSELIAAKSTLTVPQLADLVAQLKSLAAASGVGITTVLEDPAAFAEHASGGKWVRSPHLDLLAEKLAALENGTARVPRLIVNMPPRHGKSEFISHWFPIWCLARNSARKIILISYEHDFAASWGRRVRDWVRDVGNDFSLSLDPYTTAAHRWNLTSGGGMMAAGAGGPITGKGADIIIVDDPIKNEEEASSEIQREALWSWFQTVVMTRLEPGGFIVVLGTRWHQDDLLGRLEAFSKPNTENERQGLEYEILKLPAIAGNNDEIGRKPGEALWPARFPIEKLQDIRKGMSPYHFSALYQQTPTPEEGNAVKRTWWRYWEDLPEMDIMIQSWDLSFFDMQKSDFCVGQVWGRHGAQFYLIDQVRDRMNAPQVIEKIRRFVSIYPKAIGKIIEARANGPAVVQIMQREVPGMIPVTPKGSKDARLQSIIPIIESRNVHIPSPERSSWVPDFVEECAAFPRGRHDDQVDAMVHALRYLQPQAWAVEDRAQREAISMVGKATTPIEHHNQRVFAALNKERKKFERSFNASQRIRY
jgi:predicted phage terminase large subunit-like protein